MSRGRNRIVCTGITVLLVAFLLAVPCSAAELDYDVYKLESDLVYTYKMKQTDGYAEIRQLLSELKAIDEDLGRTWENIMNYWEYVNYDMTTNPEILPDGLPGDDSLCIVVLGFQLNRDGTMSEELVGRCQTALNCAEKYPQAYIAVTGGGTALDEPDLTEADLMAWWLIDHGVDPDRIIIENQSLTTGENAQRTCRILLDDYPQIRHLAVVTSEYHIQLGCLVFQEQMLLSANRRGTPPVDVISNAVFPISSADSYSETSVQASYVWKLADTRE